LTGSIGFLALPEYNWKYTIAAEIHPYTIAAKIHPYTIAANTHSWRAEFYADSARRWSEGHWHTMYVFQVTSHRNPRRWHTRASAAVRFAAYRGTLLIR